jgi:hypothetical protein
VVSVALLAVGAASPWRRNAYIADAIATCPVHGSIRSNLLDDAIERICAGVVVNDHRPSPLIDLDVDHAVERQHFLLDFTGGRRIAL